MTACSLAATPRLSGRVQPRQLRLAAAAPARICGSRALDACEYPSRAWLHYPCARCAARTAAAGSNLGMLESLAAPDAPATAAAQAFAASTASDLPRFTGGGVINVDAGAIASSLIVLVLLLALSFNRILGLERLLGRWLQAMGEQRQYERRNEAIAARQALEQQFSDGGDGGDGSSGGKDRPDR